jgi:hypothetical protein
MERGMTSKSTPKQTSNGNLAKMTTTKIGMYVSKRRAVTLQKGF